jgi:hypothetical protein
MRSPCEMIQRMRYWFYPQSKIIDEKTEIIDQNIVELRRQKEITKQMISNVNQPDVLRSLVISMSNPNG